jgi:D-aminoacyl-tRNA deacylase
LIAVIQRVSGASVRIEGKEYSSIGRGYVALLGIKKGDSDNNGLAIAKKIVDLRIFEDTNGKMNLGLRDIEGEILAISQFTLCTDNTKSGNRPSFTLAEEPKEANRLYELIVDEMKQYYDPEKIKTGVFAAEMQISLVNEGPVTIILEK